MSGGIRLNHTKETRSGNVMPTDPLVPPDSSSDQRGKWRLSGAVGASYALWQWPGGDFTTFINYRNTYKPAAVDFGPEGEGEILEPETAYSWEGGVKGAFAQGRIDWEMSLFDMRFNNLVIRENIGGLPALANAGKERFRGAEFELNWRASPDLTLLANAAFHDAKFTDYARLNGGVIQQLAGKKLELAPHSILGAGFVFAPESGFRASTIARYISARWLNKSNTARAESYTSVDASIGYSAHRWTLALHGENLTDRRDPVAESELGDAQFYTLPGRVVRLELTRAF
jgi:outer membrane receptor protein involved in Fe transport